MAERQASGVPAAGGGPVDSELNFRGILAFVLGLVTVTLVVMGLMWGVAVLLKRAHAREDPAPPALAEARESRVPPAPNLQPDPTADLAAFRAAEDAELATWAWVDRAKSVARVPVERALEIVAARGLPPPPPIPPPAPAPRSAP